MDRKARVKFQLEHGGGCGVAALFKHLPGGTKLNEEIK